MRRKKDKIGLKILIFTTAELQIRRDEHLKPEIFCKSCDIFGIKSKNIATFLEFIPQKLRFLCSEKPKSVLLILYGLKNKNKAPLTANQVMKNHYSLIFQNNKGEKEDNIILLREA